MRVLATLLLAGLLTGLLAGCTAPSSSTAAGACDGVQRSSLTLASATHSVALLATSKGCIVAELFDDKTPLTVANFRTYANETAFDGVLFHRIIKDFMVQTGSMAQDGQFRAATHPPVKNEAASSGLKNAAYTLSMARTQSADSATNQFFINHADNTFLDPSGSSAGYAVFGTVVKGRDVVDAIAATPVEAYAPGKHCQPDSQPSCPTTDIVLQTVRIL